MQSRRNKNVYAAMETFIVPGSDAATQSGALITGTNALGIANGRIGILSKDFDGTVLANVMKTTEAATAVKAISILQGTPNSGQINRVSAHGIGHKAFIESAIINAGSIVSVANSKYNPGQYASQMISALTDIATDTNYNVYVNLRSVRREREFGRTNEDTVGASVSVPSTINSSYINDYLLMKAALKLNAQSNQATGNRPFVVLGIDSDGSGTGTAISGLAVGDSVQFATIGGVTYSITLNNAMYLALQDMYGLENDAEIVLLTDAAAGTSAHVDSILAIGLDEVLAEDDEVGPTKVDVRLTMSYPDGLTSDYTHTQVSRRIEEKNSGRKLLLEFNNKARMQQYSLENQPYLQAALQAPSYIDEDGIYNVITIEYQNGEQLITGVSHEVAKVKFLLPASDDTDYADITDVNGIVVTNDYTTLATSLDNNLAAWVNSSQTFRPIDYQLEWGSESAFFTI